MILLKIPIEFEPYLAPLLFILFGIGIFSELRKVFNNKRSLILDHAEVVNEELHFKKSYFATKKRIAEIVRSIDWNKFHFIFLDDQAGTVLYISGNLGHLGLASRIKKNDKEKELQNPPKNQEEIISILHAFFESEERLRSEYFYK